MPSFLIDFLSLLFEQILITAGTPPHNDQSPRVTIKVLKLNEITHLQINNIKEKITDDYFKNDWESFTTSPFASSPFASSPFTSSTSLSDFLLGNIPKGDSKSEKNNELGFIGGSSANQEILEKDNAKESINRISGIPPVSQDIYIVVQQLGNGRVVRIVSDIKDFENMGDINTNSAADLKVRIVLRYLLCVLCIRQKTNYSYSFEFFFLLAVRSFSILLALDGHQIL